MKRILLTGANGFIGRNLIDMLLINGYEVIGIDFFADRLEKYKKHLNFTFIKADISEINYLPQKARDSDCIIHTAGLVHGKSTDLSKRNYFKINHDGTKNIVSLMNKKTFKTIIFLSTVSVYGDISCGIIPDETTPPSPKDFYGESKLAAESFLVSESKTLGFNYIIFRLTPVYDRDFLLNLKKRILLPFNLALYRISSGNQLLSICSVKNIDIVLASLKNEKLLNETFIIKDEKDYSFNEMIDIFKSELGMKFRLIITIPSFIPKVMFKILSFFHPKKAFSLLYAFNKVDKNFIYSNKKISHYGINPKWNLRETLKKPIL